MNIKSSRYVEMCQSKKSVEVYVPETTAPKQSKVNIVAGIDVEDFDNANDYVMIYKFVNQTTKESFLFADVDMTREDYLTNHSEFMRKVFVKAYKYYKTLPDNTIASDMEIPSNFKVYRFFRYKKNQFDMFLGYYNRKT